MKLNFWQIVGVVFLILGLAGIAYEKFIAKSDTKPAIEQPATTPSTLPVGL